MGAPLGDISVVLEMDIGALSHASCGRCLADLTARACAL